ncbi:hypothetical protein HZA56_04260 [Candidatus Poribacteria bacterium]|nr:hypothetical protein [Candidatus Poribacteria bacterium]
MRYVSVLTLALLVCMSTSLTVRPSVAAEEIVTQGGYAVALAQKLGIAEGPTVKDAIGKLKEMGIEPDGGWKPDAEMTPDVVLQLYKQMADAAENGKLELTVEKIQAILRDLGVNFDLPLPPELSRPAAGSQGAPSPSTLGGAGGGGGASVSE